MTRFLGLGLVCFSALACMRDAGIAQDRGDGGDGGDVTIQPDGGGVCCPIEIDHTPYCSPGNLRVGGWAPSLAQCVGGGFDGAPYAIRTTDDHGCPVVTGDRCLAPCGTIADAGWTPPAGCPGSTRDAGADVPVGTCTTGPVIDPAVDIASRQTVSFRFQGASYLITRGYLCAPMRIESVTAAAPRPLALDMLAVCPLCANGCPAFGPMQFTEARLEPDVNPVVMLTWDARALDTCTSYVDCALSGSGRPTPDYRLQTHGWHRPVFSGRYRATFGFADPSRLPTGCVVDGNEIQCSRPTGPGPNPTTWDLCPNSRTVSVEFDLPASGDLTVDVP
jgi:hypothetical protein